jgi:hypothetical protein
MAVCEAVFDSAKLDTYPEGAGLYVAAALRPDGTLGLAFYDRLRGNLMVATEGEGGWTTTSVDGQNGDVDTGDKGIGSSLFIDTGDNFHITYVDGLSESLNYVMVAGGTAPGAIEVVDDGLSPADGPHLVGDDSNVFVTQGGEVRVSYQDATAGQLRVARRTAAGTWEVQTIEQEGFAGFFSRQVEVNGGLQVLNWWRVASPVATGDVRLLSP